MCCCCFVRFTFSGSSLFWAMCCCCFVRFAFCGSTVFFGPCAVVVLCGLLFFWLLSFFGPCVVVVVLCGLLFQGPLFFGSCVVVLLCGLLFADPRSFLGHVLLLFCAVCFLRFPVISFLNHNNNSNTPSKKAQIVASGWVDFQPFQTSMCGLRYTRLSSSAAIPGCSESHVLFAAHVFSFFILSTW